MLWFYWSEACFTTAVKLPDTKLLRAAGHGCIGTTRLPIQFIKNSGTRLGLVSLLELEFFPERTISESNARRLSTIKQGMYIDVH